MKRRSNDRSRKIPGTACREALCPEPAESGWQFERCKTIPIPCKDRTSARPCNPDLAVEFAATKAADGIGCRVVNA